MRAAHDLQSTGKDEETNNYSGLHWHCGRNRWENSQSNGMSSNASFPSSDQALGPLSLVRCSPTGQTRMMRPMQCQKTGTKNKATMPPRDTRVPRTGTGPENRGFGVSVGTPECNRNESGRVPATNMCHWLLENPRCKCQMQNAEQPAPAWRNTIGTIFAC